MANYTLFYRKESDKLLDSEKTLDRGILWNVICAAISAALVIIMAVICIVTDAEDKEMRLRYSLFEDDVRSIIVDNNRIMEELELEDEMLLSLPGGSYMSLIFTSPKRALYDEIYPLMKGKDGEVSLIGSVCISPDDLPGMAGNITLEEYAELTAAGYETLIFYDGTEPLYSYLERTEKSLAELSIPMPEGVMLDRKLYTEGLLSELADAGFTDIIYSGDDTAVRDHKTDYESGPWSIKYYGWRDYTIAVYLKGYIEGGGGYAPLRVDFGTELGNKYTGYFQLENEPFDEGDARASEFKAMLNKYRLSHKERTLFLTTAKGARDDFVTYKEEYAELEQIVKARKAELQAEFGLFEDRMLSAYISRMEVGE